MAVVGSTKEAVLGSTASLFDRIGESLGIDPTVRVQSGTVGDLVIATKCGSAPQSSKSNCAEGCRCCG